MSTDTLRRDDAPEPVYSPALLAKVTSVAKSKKFRTRTLTAKEVTELSAAIGRPIEDRPPQHEDEGIFGAWFMHKGRQITVTPQANGTAVIFAL